MQSVVAPKSFVKPSLAPRAGSARLAPCMAQKLQGTVTSNKVPKTVTVTVERLVTHPKYGKFYKSSKNYIVDDQEGQAKTGDFIEIAPIPPKSKAKRFKVSQIIRKSDAVIEELN